MQRALIIVVIMLSAAMAIGCGSYTSLQSSQKSPPKISAMTVNDVIALSKANTGDEVIIAQIQATHSVFALNNQDIIDLKNAGVSEKIIEAMIKTQAQSKKDDTYAHHWYPSDDWWYAGYYWPVYYWYPRVYWDTTIYLRHTYGGHFSGRHTPAGHRSFGRR
jgi:hypothetical protein